jgi:hypothetical protein
MLGTRVRCVRPITLTAPRRYRFDHGVGERRGPRFIRERAENPQGEWNVNLNIDGLAGRDGVLGTRKVSVHKLPQRVIGVGPYAPELRLEVVWGKLVAVHQLGGA